MAFGARNQSGIVSVIGVIVAVVAVIGTQMLGWEWGDGQLVPSVIGFLAAAIALVVVVRRMKG